MDQIKNTRSLFTFFAALFIPILSFGQATDGIPDTTFNPYGAISGDVQSTTTDDSGRIVVGGEFSVKQMTNHIGKLSDTGTPDLSFNTGSGLEGQVSDIVTQNDGKIIIVGSFDSYNGQSVNRIARLNTDGSLDSTFETGSGFDGNVMSILLQDDGKIILSGFFSSYDGETHHKIIRLNPDGRPDTTFDSGDGFDGLSPFDVIVQEDGKILVGGIFNEYNGHPCDNIVRLNPNGSYDTTFNNAGFSGTVRKLATQSDGKIVVAGGFSSYGEEAHAHIIRLMPDGTVDDTFDTGTGFNNDVTDLAIQSDGKIIAGGMFTTYNEINNNYIVRLHPDGSHDDQFQQGSGFDDHVWTLHLLDNKQLLVGGDFQMYNNNNVNYLTRLNEDGVTDTTFGHKGSINNSVGSITMGASGHIFIGGTFTAHSNQVNIAALDVDGVLDRSFTPGPDGFDELVIDVALQDDDKIIAIGNFSTFNQTTCNNIARLHEDGRLDTTFDTGTGFNNTASAMVIQPDGKIVITGRFTEYNNMACNGIIRLNPDGTPDETFDPGDGLITSQLHIGLSLHLQQDGKIILGGLFDTYDGEHTPNLVRIHPDGAYDATFETGNGPNNLINTIAEDATGQLIIGGGFTSYNDHPVSRLARLHPNGTVDSLLDTENGFDMSVWTLYVQEDGRIVVGGGFTAYNGKTANHLIRLHADGVRDTTFHSVHNIDGDVNSLSRQSDNHLIIGGRFTTFGSSKKEGIARVGLTKSGCLNARITNHRHVICKGDSDGAVIIEGIYGGVTPYTYDWEGLEYDSPVAHNLPPGDYNVTISDAENNCDTTITTTIQEPDSLIVTGETIGDSISISVQGGTTPYAFDWNGPGGFTASSPHVGGLENGDYIVSVTDDNGCNIESDPFQIYITGVEHTLSDKNIHLYPNPAKDMLSIELPENTTGPVTVRILNQQGVEKINQTIKTTEELNVHRLQNGVYVLILQANNRTYHSKIIINK